MTSARSAPRCLVSRIDARFFARMGRPAPEDRGLDRREEATHDDEALWTPLG